MSIKNLNLYISKKCLNDLKYWISNNFPQKKYFILISDKKIMKNCDKVGTEELYKIFNQILIIDNPVASLELAKDIANNKIKIEQNTNSNLVIAMGSGTINDLAKYASYLLKVDYMVIPTATSMNGYFSANASLSANHHKKTFTANSPKAVFCDINLVKTAPKNLNIAGIADSLAFYSCKFDWLLSHLIFDTKISLDAIKLANKAIDEVFDAYNINKEKYNIDNDDFLEKLMRILIMLGEAMNIAKGSYPASQSEHLIAHSLTMKYPDHFDKIYHGRQIATTLIDSITMQEKIYQSKNIRLANIDFDYQEMVDFFGSFQAKEIQIEYQNKLEIFVKKNFLNNFSNKEWERIKNEINSYFNGNFMTKNRILEIFYQFNIEYGLKDFAINEQDYKECLNKARFIRNRITCLDIILP